MNHPFVSDILLLVAALKKTRVNILSKATLHVVYGAKIGILSAVS